MAFFFHVDADEEDDADEGDHAEVGVRDAECKECADAGGGERGEDGDRVDETFIEDTEDDVDGGDGGEDEDEGVGLLRLIFSGGAGEVAVHGGGEAHRGDGVLDFGDGLSKGHRAGEVERDRDGGKGAGVIDGERRGGGGVVGEKQQEGYEAAALLDFT